MTAITLKNIPDDLLDALREAAEGDRRSLNQEILSLLAAALEGHPAGPAVRSPVVGAQLRAWRKLAGKWKSDVSPSTEARRLLRRRSAGRKVKL